MRDRGFGDLARDLTPRLVVEAGIGRRPSEALAEPHRAAERFGRALGTDAICDPLRGGELPFDPARHHHRVDARLQAGDHDVLDRDVGDAAHIEGVRHGKAVEAQLAA